jgi:hypothetical protein
MNAAALGRIGSTANLVKFHKSPMRKTTMHKIIKATLLTLALAIPVWAGDMGCPIASPPGGQQSQPNTGLSKTANIGFPLTGTEIAISLLQTMLALF